MFRFHGLLLVAAATVFPFATSQVVAGEVIADPACRTCRPGTSYYGPPVVSYKVTACYDPCEKVGPVRRFLRRIFRPCCPPPAVSMAPVRIAAPIVVPSTTVSAPVQINRPVPLPQPEPPTAPFPGTGSSLRRDGVLTPPTTERPVPIRLDRIASRSEESVVVRAQSPVRYPVVLIDVDRPTLQQRAEANESGQFRVRLSAGRWEVYTKNSAGKQVSQGRIEVRETGEVSVQLRNFNAGSR